MDVGELKSGSKNPFAKNRFFDIGIQKIVPQKMNSKMILGSILRQFSGQIAFKTQQTIYARHTPFSFRFHKTA